MKDRQKLTLISTLHYLRLVYRSVLLILLIIEYISRKIHPREFLDDSLERQPLIYFLVWVGFFVEMILRFIPSKYESPGCQKQFKRNYIKSVKTDKKGYATLTLSKNL